MADGPIFTQRAVNQIFSHVPIKTLRWWALQGLYGWINEIKDKRGVSREYSLSNLYQIGIVENLSSLEIKVNIVRSIMNKLGNNPSMDKIIIITKHPVKSEEVGPIGDKLRKTPMFMWHDSIITPEGQDELLKHYRENHKIAIIVVINLASIKQFIDSLIKEF